MLEDVLDLGRAVEGDLGKVAVKLAHTCREFFTAVRKVRSPKVIWRAPAVTNWAISAITRSSRRSGSGRRRRRHRAVPALVHAAVAGLDVPRELLLAIALQPRIALEGRQAALGSGCETRGAPG